MNSYRNLKRWICELPISRKIITIFAVSSFVTLGTLCALSVYRDWNSYRDRQQNALETISEIVASNIAAPLRFQDRGTASEQLLTFEHQTEITKATLFDANSEPFANYSRVPSSTPLPKPEQLGFFKSSDGLMLATEVLLNGEHLGVLLIQADQSALQAIALKSILVSLALFGGAMAISILLAYRMQKLIALPISDLNKVAQDVATTDNYAARAVKRYNDEVGSLVDGFNSMLNKISERDASLREINANLERLVEQRTQDLRIQNLALKEAMDAAEAASIAKSEFLATTSHELRTPLNPIIGYVEKVQRENPNGNHSKELELIRTSAEQLLRLIDDILDFSRIESGTLRLSEDQVNLEQLCEEVVNLLKPQAKKKSITLAYSYHDDCEKKHGPCCIRVDQGRLRQVLLNLTNNAVKFTHQGSVTIEAKVTRTSPETADVCISIADTGIGIEDNDKKKLFKPFSQIDASWSREYGGMGLGLAICQRIAHAMRGTLACESERGVGSVFTINIPVAIEQRDQSPKEDDQLPDFHLAEGARVLLAEDEPVNRELMEALVSSLGHTVVTAKNGLEATEIAQKEIFDFILLDISMPRMDGFTATKAIRALDNANSHAPIIAMTAHATSEDRDKCRAAGMSDYIAKPVSFTRLKSILSKWIQTQRPTG